VTVYPARINCNFKSQTIEEIKGHRQKEILAMLPYLEDALQRDIPVLVEALAADLKKEKAKRTQLKKLDALEAQISRDFDALSTDLATPEKMSWLNQDSNYKQSICEVIDFKHVRMSKLVRELSALTATTVRSISATFRIHSPWTSTWLPGRDESRLLPRCCRSVPTLMPKTRRAEEHWSWQRTTRRLRRSRRGHNARHDT
jgi:hypothetical protein